MKVLISEIDVGKRFRKDMGDLDSLAQSMEELGLLQPIVIRKADNKLIAGMRRLKAAKKLKWDKIEAHVVNGLDEALKALSAERDENTCRKDFENTEAYAAGQAIVALVKPANEAKQQEDGAKGKEHGKKGGRGKKKTPSADSAEGVSGNGHQPLPEPPKNNAKPTHTREAAAEAANVSPETYRKMAAVMDAAKEDPELYGDLPKLMDEKSVEAAFKEMNSRKRRKQKQEELEARAAESVGQEGGYEVRCGDVLEESVKIESASIHLIFVDSPYNIGIDYGEGVKADRLSDDQFVSWCSRWIAECHRVLRDDGTLWLMIGDEYADYLGLELRKAGFYRRAWVKWYETFGVYNSAKSNFSRTSRHLFYCTKSKKNFTFNPEAVLRPSDRQEEYADKRAAPEGKIWDDVWEIPRVVGNAKERLPEFPTQLPLDLLRAVVGCSSNPGDLVLDLFSGSATTGVAALELGRAFLGIEKNKAFADASLLRLKGVKR